MGGSQGSSLFSGHSFLWPFLLFRRGQYLLSPGLRRTVLWFCRFIPPQRGSLQVDFPTCVAWLALCSPSEAFLRASLLLEGCLRLCDQARNRHAGRGPGGAELGPGGGGGAEPPEREEPCPRQLCPSRPFQATRGCREERRPGDERNTVLTSYVSSLPQTDAERKPFLLLTQETSENTGLAIPHSGSPPPPLFSTLL